MKKAVEEAGGTVLEYVDTRSPTLPRVWPADNQLAAESMAQAGPFAAINDLYFDFMGQPLPPQASPVTRAEGRFRG